MDSDIWNKFCFDFANDDCNLATVVISSFLIGLVTVVIFRRNKRNSPPGPYGVPLLGVLPLMTSRPDKKVMEWVQQHGDVMTLKFLTNKLIVISSMEALNEGLVRKGEDYANRPWCYLHDYVWMRSGISVTNVCPEWKEQRKFSLTSLRKFGFGRKTLVENIIVEADHFCEALIKLDGDFLAARELLTELNANIILHLTLGRRCDYEKDTDFLKFFHKVSEHFNDASFAIQATIFVPWFHHIPPFRSVLRKLRSLFVKLHDDLRDELTAHHNHFDPEDIRDFADDYTKEILTRDSRNIGLFNNEMLMYILRDFFLAGTETSATTLSWAMLILCNRKDTVLKKVREEIGDVVGPDGLPTLDHRKQMHYTMAFLLEVMRYRTVLPFGVARMTSSDTTLGKFFIPKGTTVLENLYAVHNDPKYWVDPDVFRVERHLNAKGEFVKSPNVIPFGIGLRYCVGKQLAEMQIFIVLVRILQRFDLVSRGEKIQDEDVAKIGFISMAPFDTKITFVERK